MRKPTPYNVKVHSLLYEFYRYCPVRTGENDKKEYLLFDGIIVHCHYIFWSFACVICRAICFYFNGEAERFVSIQLQGMERDYQVWKKRTKRKLSVKTWEKAPGLMTGQF